MFYFSFQHDDLPSAPFPPGLSMKRFLEFRGSPHLFHQHPVYGEGAKCSSVYLKYKKCFRSRRVLNQINIF